MILTDDLWEAISILIPPPKKAQNGAGRPAYSRRLVLEGILWVLSSGARWRDLPKDFPSYQTCHNLFQEWQRQGVFEDIFQTLLARKVIENGTNEVTSAFIDGTFVPAKKGARSLAEVTKEKAAQLWPSAMALVSLLDLASTGQTRTRQTA
jgi:transposase